MTDLATLGIKIESSGVEKGTLSLEKMVSASKKAEAAASSLYAQSAKAAASVGGMSAAIAKAEFAAGRIYNAKVINDARQYAAQVEKATVSLKGFDAVTAHVAQRVEAMATQWQRGMERLTSWDLRNEEIQQYGRELDQLRARFNPLFAAQQKFEAVSQEIARAQSLGAITAEEASAALMRERAAYDSVTAAINANTTAASRNRAVRPLNAAHTTNLLFQAQDIAMMTAMGQAPGMLAMQQGMQVAGVFHQIGNGRQIVQAMGGAIAGLLNPLNLATIAFIGLGAAGVQALMGMGQRTDDLADSVGGATSALEQHKAWLNDILRGYGDIAAKAEEAAERANMLPQASVEYEAGRSFTEWQETYAETLRDIEAHQGRINELIATMERAAGFGDLLPEQSEYLQNLVALSDALSMFENLSNASRAELDHLDLVLRQIRDTAPDEIFRNFAEGLLETVQMSRSAKGEIDRLASAMGQLPRNVQILIDVQASTDRALSAIDELRNLAPDLRDGYQRARDALNEALGSGDGLLREMARREYENTIAALDEQARRAKDRASSRGGGRSGPEFNSYELATKAVNDNISAMQLEMSVLGQSAQAASKMRMEYELMNAAREAGVALTPKVLSDIEMLSTAYAGVEEQLRRMNEIYDLGLGITKGLFSDVTSYIRENMSEWKTWGDVVNGVWAGIGQAASNALTRIADKFLENAAIGIWDMLFGSIFSTLGGSNIMTSGGMRTASFTPGVGWMSFDGGGFTGYGPRSGGLDGLGGFPAILHPNETVIDHTLAANANRPVASTHTSGGDVYVTIERIEANSEAEGAAAARGFQAEMRRWQQSGEGAAYVRAVVNNPGRRNPKAA